MELQTKKRPFARPTWLWWIIHLHLGRQCGNLRHLGTWRGIFLLFPYKFHWSREGVSYRGLKPEVSHNHERKLATILKTWGKQKHFQTFMLFFSTFLFGAHYKAVDWWNESIAVTLELPGEGVPRDLDSLFEAMDLNRDGSWVKSDI